MKLTDRVLSAAGRSVLGAPFPLLRLLAGAPDINDEGAVLDRQAQALLQIGRRLRFPKLHELGPVAGRAEMTRQVDLVSARGIEVGSVEDVVVPSDGAMLAARLYQPAGVAGARPGLLYLHGGGFVVGGLDSHDAFCRRLCRDAQIGVLSLDYRLAPEHPWPAACEDVLAAWRWLVAHTSSLSLDREALAVGGDSAGGNLAVLLSVALRDRGERAPAVQLLVYPGIDLTRSHASHARFGRGYLLETETMDWFLDCYVPDSRSREDPRASPWHVRDLSGLPRTLLVYAGFDPLRDEGRAFGERLAEANVPIVSWCEPTLVHGFVNLDGAIASAARANARIATELERALGV